MANPHIVTFERDIENEIRNKSASLTDIAASSGVVENKPEKSALGWLILVLIAIVILGAGVGAYVYYAKQANKTASEAATQEKNTKSVEVFGSGTSDTKETRPESTKNEPKAADTLGKRKLVQSSLDAVFPNVFPYVGKNFIKAETLGGGYIITFSGYNEVYKGIFDNEALFFSDILKLYGDTSKNTTSPNDIRIGELDARLASGDSGKKVYYAFIKPSTLILGDSKEVMTILSDAILK